jgi:hypothetical protein
LILNCYKYGNAVNFSFKLDQMIIVLTMAVAVALARPQPQLLNTALLPAGPNPNLFAQQQRPGFGFGM